VCLLVALHAPLKVTECVSLLRYMLHSRSQCVCLLRCVLHSRSLSVCVLIALCAALKVTDCVSPYCAVYSSQGHRVCALYAAFRVTQRACLVVLCVANNGFRSSAVPENFLILIRLSSWLSPPSGCEWWRRHTDMDRGCENVESTLADHRPVTLL